MTDRSRFHGWRRVLPLALGALALGVALWVLVRTGERAPVRGAPLGAESARTSTATESHLLEPPGTPASQPAETQPEPVPKPARSALALATSELAERATSATTVRFVAMDELGVPLRDVRMNVSHERWTVRPSVEIVTDSDGRAELRVPHDLLGDALELHARRPRNRDRLIADLHGSLAPGGPGADERERHVGRVVLEGPPPSASELLVAGHVLDELGAPIDDASLRVTPEAAQRAWRASGPTGADGSFRMLGPAAERLRVEVRADGHTTLEQDGIEAGATGLVFRLARSARLDVEVLLDAQIPADLLTLDLVGPIARSRMVRPRLVVRDLPAGEYDLEVRTVWGHWPVARVEGLVVRAEEASDDPRVHPLDLRGTIAPCRLLLRSSKGVLIAGEVVIVHAAGYGAARVRTDENGRLLLLVPAGAGEIEVRPPGYAAQRCVPSASERTLDFQPE